MFQQASPQERERRVEDLSVRLDPLMTVLSILFVLVVLGQFVPTSSRVDRVLLIATWVLWGAFVAEFVVRLTLAPAIAPFLRRNWWQVVLLLLPFLGFLRIVRLARLSRAGRILSSSIRATRRAQRSLRNRLLWVSAIHVIVILGGAELAVEFAGYRSLLPALYDVAYAATTGEPLRSDTGLAQVMEIVLAIYSVVVFAAIAGTVGAFFLERTAERKEEDVRAR